MTVAQVFLEEFWDLKIPVDAEFMASKAFLCIETVERLSEDAELDEGVRLVRVRYGLPEELRRYAVARELGRFCARENTRSRGRGRNPDDVTSFETDAFARELLMPAVAVKVMVDRRGIRDAKKLREAFGVSASALFLRLKELRYFL